MYRYLSNKFRYVSLCINIFQTNFVMYRYVEITITKHDT